MVLLQAWDPHTSDFQEHHVTFHVQISRRVGLKFDSQGPELVIPFVLLLLFSVLCM